MKIIRQWISQNGMESRHTPFSKYMVWKQLEKVFKNFVDPDLWKKCAKWEGRTLRRFHIKDIVDSCQPNIADIKLRNIGMFNILPLNSKMFSGL